MVWWRFDNAKLKVLSVRFTTPCVCRRLSELVSLRDDVLTGRYAIFVKSAPVGSWNTRRPNSGIIARI